VTFLVLNNTSDTYKKQKSTEIVKVVYQLHLWFIKRITLGDIGPKINPLHLKSSKNTIILLKVEKIKTQNISPTKFCMLQTTVYRYKCTKIIFWNK